MLSEVLAIKYGKSGEILMARYAGFSACFRNVRGETAFIKQNLLQKSSLDLFDELTFSTMMKKKIQLLTNLKRLFTKFKKPMLRLGCCLKNTTTPQKSSLAPFQLTGKTTLKLNPLEWKSLY